MPPSRSARKSTFPHRGSASGDRRRVHRQAPTAFCRGKIGVVSIVLVAASAKSGCIDYGAASKAFSLGFHKGVFLFAKRNTPLCLTAGREASALLPTVAAKVALPAFAGNSPAASSKAPRCIRHWRRFGAFPAGAYFCRINCVYPKKEGHIHERE